MELSSPIDSFSLYVKCLHILIIAILSIELIDSIKHSLPIGLSKFIILWFLHDDTDLLSWQKNNSIGANSGVYWGRNIQDHFVLHK